MGKVLHMKRFAKRSLVSSGKAQVISAVCKWQSPTEVVLPLDKRGYIF